MILIGACVLAVPALLPSWQVAWLVKPLIGVEVRPLAAGLLGVGSAPDRALSAAIGGIGIVAIVFYLDHCVVNQPLWAVVGGWGLLIAGFVTANIQEIIGSSRTTFVDIEHHLWPFGVVLLVIGATVILVSWWRAPESFSPRLSRWTLIALAPAIAIITFAEHFGLGQAAIVALTP